MRHSERAPLIIGHRGASGYRPEHSESAYRLAFELGSDLVEPDIVATSDGVLVVRHENEISGTTDVADRPEFADRRTTKTVDGESLTGWFTEDFTWAELSTLRCRERLSGTRPGNRDYDGAEPLLRLRDVLAIVDEESARLDRPLGVVVEVKHARYFLDLGIDLGALLLDELAATGWDARPGRLVVESFELGVIDRLRAAGLPASYVFLMEVPGGPADEPLPGAPARDYEWYRGDAGLELLAGRVEGISVDKSLLVGDSGQDLVGRAHERGLLVFTWTLRPENRFLSRGRRTAGEPAEWGDWAGEFGAVLRTGVDGIFVDHPDLGCSAREALAAGGA